MTKEELREIIAIEENFPHVNDYRNSVVAGMMKTLNYVNMFNHGVGDVQEQLKENDSPAAEFNVNYLTAFSVVVREPDESRLPKLAQVNGKAITNGNQEVINELSQAFPELAQILPKQLGAVLHACERETTLAELMIALSATSRRTFVRKVLNPILAANLIKHTHPENPRHPQQRYCLTELGLEMLKLLNEDKQ